jgi:hypothetical protein
MGKLSEEASRGLKAIEITIVRIDRLDKGTFTLDMEAIAVSPNAVISRQDGAGGKPRRSDDFNGCSAFLTSVSALPVGKSPSFEELFTDVISSEHCGTIGKAPVLTADDLGFEISIISRKYRRSPC